MDKTEKIVSALPSAAEFVIRAEVDMGMGGP